MVIVVTIVTCILLSVFMTCVSSLIAIVISFILCGIDFHNMELAENKLLKMLQLEAENAKIPVYIKTDLGNAAGRITYYQIQGQYNFERSYIEILTKYKDKPWVLAHELGHYIAISKHSDDSEQRADHEGRMLCESLLSKREKKSLSTLLSIYLPKMEQISVA